MRILSALFFFLIVFASPVQAQVTLVRQAPSDSFNLSCASCSLAVAEVALTRGQHAIPMNMRKPVAVNLLMWKYYDDILKKETLMAKEPFWTKGVQLIEEVPDTQMLSLHLNLIWTDSAGIAHRLYLVAAGITKGSLSRLPLVAVFDTDTYAPLRFSAVAQVFKDENDWETYDCLEGTFSLDRFDARSGVLGGHFDFTGNRIGMEKLGFFLNGRFQR